MKSIRLLKSGYKKVGWIFLIVGTLLWIGHQLDWINFPNVTVFIIAYEDLFAPYEYYTFKSLDIVPTLAGVIVIIGGLLITFSKEKIEDEFIHTLRLRSFQWAFLLNYIILLILFIFVYEWSFLYVMLYQMFLILILYILRFHYLLYLNRAEV